MLEKLNLLFGGDTYPLSYDDIKNVFKNHYRAAKKKGRASQGLVNSTSSKKSIKNEIGNRLEDFKSEMMHNFALHMHTMQIKR